MQKHQEYRFGDYKGMLASRQIFANNEGLGPPAPMRPHLLFTLSGLLSTWLERSAVCTPTSQDHSPGALPCSLSPPLGASSPLAFPLPTELCGCLWCFFLFKVFSLFRMGLSSYSCPPKWGWSRNSSLGSSSTHCLLFPR